MSSPRAAIVAMDSWAGRIEQKCWVVDETPQRYRITPRAGSLRLTGRRVLDWGQSTLVPKYAVRFVESQ